MLSGALLFVICLDRLLVCPLPDRLFGRLSPSIQCSVCPPLLLTPPALSGAIYGCCLAMCRPFSFVGCISIVAICRLPVCLSGYFRRLAVVIFPPVVECLPCPPVSHLFVAVYVRRSYHLFGYHCHHRCRRHPVGYESYFPDPIAYLNASGDTKKKQGVCR